MHRGNLRRQPHHRVQQTTAAPSTRLVRWVTQFRRRRVPEWYHLVAPKHEREVRFPENHTTDPQRSCVLLVTLAALVTADGWTGGRLDAGDLPDATLPQRGCDHTSLITREWAQHQAVAFDVLAAWCLDNGGHCDCEVLADCEQHWQDAKHDVDWQATASPASPLPRPLLLIEPAERPRLPAAAGSTPRSSGSRPGS